MKVNNKKGFTLAELLIVVAIIGVLIAIAMPTFGSQLDKARAATEEANARSTYGEAVAEYLTTSGSQKTLDRTYDGIKYTAETTDGTSWTVTLSKSNTKAAKTTYTFGSSTT